MDNFIEHKFNINSSPYKAYKDNFNLSLIDKKQKTKINSISSKDNFNLLIDKKQKTKINSNSSKDIFNL